MAARTRKISTLIESQLPGFISSEYENFSKFVEKYYEQLEAQGQPLDIINNITKYRDINFYEKDLLNQKTVLTTNVSDSLNYIDVESTASFPKENGYIRVGDEICFYKSKTDTRFLEVSRGVSGNTTLGDLYSETEFVTTQSKPHYIGDEVYNISNLFLYAFVKSFEAQYLGAFPEKYLKDDVDKRTLIKNISNFYKAKGTDRSIRFIFNSIVTKDPTEKVEVFNPKDFTLKSSTSDWITQTALKVKILSGDPDKLVGNIITQTADVYDKDLTFASAVVDSVRDIGELGGERIYELILEPSSINGSFKISSRTKLTKSLNTSLSNGDRIDVFSTLGWNKTGKLIIGDESNYEEITFIDKNVNQFVIDSRPSPRSHSSGTVVYSYSTISSGSGSNEVKIIALGVVYDLQPTIKHPYSDPGDYIQIPGSGVESVHPVITTSSSNNRWILNNTTAKASSIFNVVNDQIKDLISDVSAIYEDDQYFYICSSGYPSYTDLLTIDEPNTLKDQKFLRLIRKFPTNTTEVYKTSNREVGIFLDGTIALGYKDYDEVVYGKIESTKIESKGTGYQNPPYVLINEQPGKARSVLSGETVESILIDTTENFESDPTIRISSGENAELKAIVTEGVITSLNVVNPGRYYSTPPRIIITDELGKGKYAEYVAILNNDGQIESCRRISGGRLFTRGKVKIEVESIGKGAQASAKVKRWIKNRYTLNQSKLDSNNGISFANLDQNKSYGYGVVANPVKLRYKLGDNISNLGAETSPLVHSPIIGFAYDGNPIYGPYGYSDPTDSTSSITRLSSGYVLQVSRPNGPSTTTYPLGSFIDDYKWVPTIYSGKTQLDQNNGRFCVTPDYPNGTYAYFITINSSNTPIYPYLLGDNFYSLPVESNYNSKISQDDIPKNVKRIKTTNIDENGSGYYGYIDDVYSGSISSVNVVNSGNRFSVDSLVVIDNTETEGNFASANVNSLKGKNVISIESSDTKAIRLKVKETSYMFANDTVVQFNDAGDDIIASGELIGDVINDNELVLRDVQGFFTTTGKIESNIKVITLVLDKISSFTKDAVVTLTDGKNTSTSNIGTGIILEGTTRQNSIKVKVTSGNFIVDSNYFLKSSNLSDTSRAKIIKKSNLSENLTVFELDENIAIVKTSENHSLSVGDFVDIDVLPEDNDTETLYNIRKKLYQTVILDDVYHKSTIVDSGIGSFTYLNSGSGYNSQTYTDVELIFQDQTKIRSGVGAPGNPNNARATVVVSDPDGSGYGPVRTITITKKGSNYKKSDVLTISDEDLERLSDQDAGTQRILIEVDHVGFAYNNTKLFLSNVNNLSVDDLLLIRDEKVKIISVDKENKFVTVSRGEDSSIPTNHYNQEEVSIYNGNYRFNDGFLPLGDSINSPILSKYNSEQKEFIVFYNYSSTNPINLVQSTSFFDNSNPAKLVRLKTVYDSQYRLEFQKEGGEFSINPIIEIQKYYKYKFDTSHISMLNTYLDFSASSNYNLFTEEKFVSDVSPGNPGSYITLKFGFGPYLASNFYTKRKPLNFSNFFYFIKVAPDINTSNSYLNIVDDPLTGPKTVIYTTPNRFVYNINRKPEYDGSGEITYTTTSKSTTGKINTVSLSNVGEGYKKLPVVSGVLPDKSYKAELQVNYNEKKKTITSVSVSNQGNGYSKPKVVVTEGDGKDYQFDIITENGKIKRISVINGGKDFSKKPTLEVIETDVEIYLESNLIGVPKKVKTVFNGASFHNDKTVLSKFLSNTIFVLKNINGNFLDGENITVVGKNCIAQVSKKGWRKNTNLLKVKNIIGTFVSGYSIKGEISEATATIEEVKTTEFTVNLKSYYDNLGFYASDRGKLSVNTQKLTDSYFYQDYSYVIKSKTSIDVWRELIKETTHPAGFELFGEMLVESEGTINMPSEQKIIETKITIDLEPKSITVINTKQQLTTSFVNFNNLKIERGLGSISVDTFDTSETIIREVVLSQPFDGDFDPLTGRRTGTKNFILKDKKTNSPVYPQNANQLIISIDGVIQEPGKAFTVKGNQIIFSESPLGEREAEGQLVASQSFYGKLLSFKNLSTLNSRYFKKLQSISSLFDGETKEFDLYYEDGSIVKSDSNEDFIVSLNGVIQKVKKINENIVDLSTKNSYYILRSEDSEITDKIVFSDAPINHEDYYESVGTEAFELGASEKCFIFDIGNYEKLTIDTSLVEYRGVGPYLIVDDLTNKVRKIDNSLYALVFVDGVLQVETKSYEIIGPNIIFTEPLRKYVGEDGTSTVQDVSIILFYGRDKDKTLTFYDFEPNTYYNVITLSLEGTGITQYVKNLFYPVRNQKTQIYQNTNLLGELKGFNFISSNNIELTLVGQNISDFNQENISFVFTETNEIITLTENYSLSFTYLVDEESQRLLGKNLPPWLFGSKAGDNAWSERARGYANLLPGDKIRIDGESSFRDILSYPNNVRTKQYNEGEFISNEIYSTVKASNYNGITRGEGLSVTCNINQFGSISSLNVTDLTWNQRDLSLYFEKGILLQPTAYEYYTNPILHFIPIDGNGGGAKAKVIAYNGQIIDIVLISGGSGYTQPPKVVVARGYDLIKEESRKIDTLTYLGISPYIAGFEMVSSSLLRTEKKGLDPRGFEIVTVNTIDSENSRRDITTILTPKISTSLVNQNHRREILRLFDPSVRAFNSLAHKETQIVRIVTAPLGIVTSFSSVTVQNTDRLITREINKVINNAIIEVPSESINDVGAFLDSPLDENDTIVYIPDTRRFPDSSRLLIGKEIVTYLSKKTDRFLGVTRGTNGTTATSHDAGDYLRHLPELISIVPVGPTSNIITEVTITEIHNTSSAVVQITSTPADQVQSVSIESTSNLITTQNQIPVNNSDFIISTQIVVDYGVTFGLVSSIVSTVSYEDTEILTGIQVETETGVQSHSSIIELGIPHTNVASISRTTNTIKSVVKEIAIIPPVSYSQITNVHSTVSSVSTSSGGLSIVASVINSVVNIDSEFEYQVNFIADVSNITTITDIVVTQGNVFSVISSVLAPVVETTFDMTVYVETSTSTISQLAKPADVTVFNKTGVIDYYVEDIILNNIVILGDGSAFVLESPYNEIVTRNYGIVTVSNRPELYDSQNYSYSRGNAGFTIEIFENNIFMDTGALAVAGTIADYETAIPYMTLGEFELNGSSSITSKNEIFNWGLPSINNLSTTLNNSLNTTDTTITIPSAAYNNQSPQITKIRIYNLTNSSALNVSDYILLRASSTDAVNVAPFVYETDIFSGLDSSENVIQNPVKWKIDEINASYIELSTSHRFTEEPVTHNTYYGSNFGGVWYKYNINTNQVQLTVNGTYGTTNKENTVIATYSGGLLNWPTFGKLLINGEIMYYQSREYGTISNIIRGYENTTPLTHYSGDFITTL